MTAVVEHEFGVLITDDYPLLKFWNQVDLLKKIKAEQDENDPNNKQKKDEKVTFG